MATVVAVAQPVVAAAAAAPVMGILFHVLSSPSVGFQRLAAAVAVVVKAALVATAEPQDLAVAQVSGFLLRTLLPVPKL